MLQPEIYCILIDIKQEILHYLKHIQQTWLTIMGGQEGLLHDIDQATVEILETTAPGRCLEDRRFLEPHMKDGRIFSWVKDYSKRQQIWNNVLSIPYLIPSNTTLSKDLQFLRPLANSISNLVEEPKPRTIRQRLRACFAVALQESNQVRIQVNEMEYRVEIGTLDVQQNSGILQLWLLAARYFSSPRKEGQSVGDQPENATPSLWHQLAVLASNLGFDNEKIRGLLSREPDAEIARTALLTARSSELFEYGQAQFDGFVSQIGKMFAQAQRRRPNVDAEQFFKDADGERRSRRSGRPFENAYRHDRHYLFLDSFKWDDQQEGENISSLFVRLSVFRAFWGDLIPNSWAQAGSLTAPLQRPNLRRLTPVTWPIDSPSTEFLSDTTRVMIQLRNERDAAVKRQAEIATELRQAHEQCLAHLTTIEEIDRRRNEKSPAHAENENRTLTEENQRLEVRLSESAKKVQELEARVHSQSMTIEDRLNKKMPWCSREAELQDTISTLQGQLNKKDKQLAQSRNQIQALKKTSRPAALWRDRTAGAVKEAAAEVENIRQERDTALANLESNLAEIVVLREGKTVLQERTTRLERDLECVRHDLCESRAHLEDYKFRDRGLQAAEQQLQQMMRDVAKNAKKDTAANQELEAKIVVVEDERDRVMKSSEDLQHQNGLLDTSLREKCALVDALQGEKLTLSRKLEQIQNQMLQYKSTRQTIEALQQENQAMMTKGKAQESELARSAKRVEELQAESTRIGYVHHEMLRKQEQEYEERLEKVHRDAGTQNQLESSVRELQQWLREDGLTHCSETAKEAADRPPKDVPLDASESRERADVTFYSEEPDGTRTGKRTLAMSPEELRHTISKGIRKRIHARTTDGRGIRPDSAWDLVVRHGDRTIVGVNMDENGYAGRSPELNAKSSARTNESHSGSETNKAILQKQFITGPAFTPSGKLRPASKSATKLGESNISPPANGRATQDNITRAAQDRSRERPLPPLPQFQFNRRGEPGFVQKMAEGVP